MGTVSLVTARSDCQIEVGERDTQLNNDEERDDGNKLPDGCMSLPDRGGDSRHRDRGMMRKSSRRRRQTRTVTLSAAETVLKQRSVKSAMMATDSIRMVATPIKSPRPGQWACSRVRGRRQPRPQRRLLRAVEIEERHPQPRRRVRRCDREFGDGCEDSCLIEAGNGRVDFLEACDDGIEGRRRLLGELPHETCGNGPTKTGEECDDGNESTAMAVANARSKEGMARDQ